jgi:uncharacterized membrane protein YebE (DUF533 family)
MIGFFEYQYLSYKKNHLKNLLALARADGTFHENEEKLLYKLGEKYRLKERQVKALIASTKPHDLHIPNTHEEKMELLYDVLLMVYADGVVDKNEIEFCHHLVERFGYKESMVEWLLDEFKTGRPPHPVEWDAMVNDAKTRFQKH